MRRIRGGGESGPKDELKEIMGVENNDDDRQFSISVTANFMGAVGFYRRGGVGKVRFGRIVVERSGSGYVLGRAAYSHIHTHVSSAQL